MPQHQAPGSTQGEPLAAGRFRENTGKQDFLFRHTWQGRKVANCSAVQVLAIALSYVAYKITLSPVCFYSTMNMLDPNIKYIYTCDKCRILLWEAFKCMRGALCQRSRAVWVQEDRLKCRLSIDDGNSIWKGGRSICDERIAHLAKEFICLWITIRARYICMLGEMMRGIIVGEPKQQSPKC